MRSRDSIWLLNQDQKIADFGGFFRTYIHSRNLVKFRLAFASRLAPTQNQNQKIAAFGSSTMSARSSTAHALDPCVPAGKRGRTFGKNSAADYIRRYH
jgi:hypothetical protein